MHNSNFTIGIFTASAFVGRMSVALSVGGVGNINWGFIRRNTFHSSALRGLSFIWAGLDLLLEAAWSAYFFSPQIEVNLAWEVTFASASLVSVTLLLPSFY